MQTTPIHMPAEAALFTEIMNAIDTCHSEAATQESTYKYVGMNDSEVESMVIANLPETMTLENVKLYLTLHRKMHTIINTSANMGEATAKGSGKLAYMLDFMEQNPSEKMTAEWLQVGSVAVEMKEAEARGNYNTHLHDLMSMHGNSRDEKIDTLLQYYLLTGDELHMGKYFDMQGEAAVENLLADLIQ